MPTITKLDNHSIISVKKNNGEDLVFIIKYNENNIVESISIYANNLLSEIDSISDFISKGIHIDDVNDELIKLIMDFEHAKFYLNCAIDSAKENRRYKEIFGLE